MRIKISSNGILHCVFNKSFGLNRPSINSVEVFIHRMVDLNCQTSAIMLSSSVQIAKWPCLNLPCASASHGMGIWDYGGASNKREQS